MDPPLAKKVCMRVRLVSGPERLGGKFDGETEAPWKRRGRTFGGWLPSVGGGVEAARE